MINEKKSGLCQKHDEVTRFDGTESTLFDKFLFWIRTLDTTSFITVRPLEVRTFKLAWEACVLFEGAQAHNCLASFCYHLQLFSKFLLSSN